MKNEERVNAVAMVRKIRDKHHEMLKNKSPEERRRFYRETAKALHDKLGVGEQEEEKSA